MNLLTLFIILLALAIFGACLRLFINWAEKVNFPMNIYYRINFRKERKERRKLYGRE